ncbi:MAG: AbrB/MazE/SpoVT family DNA-binding domain-containing protein [Devosia sp.]|nr:AbrB/MazE/SpoVT family DNA-binding domain-containing protein [Devosia sp.]
MRVSKWGNSLAIRLPSMVVEALQLREGDEVSLRPGSGQHLEVVREASRSERIARLRDLLKGRLPADFRFDREQANER